MKKSLLIVGAFMLFAAAPSFGQNQNQTDAVSAQKHENTSVLQKQEVKSEIKKVKTERKALKVQKIEAVPTTPSSERKASKEAVRKEN